MSQLNSIHIFIPISRFRSKKYYSSWVTYTSLFHREVDHTLYNQI
jgi:hypothetical protein